MGALGWTAMALCLLMEYPLSFGPACWLSTKGNMGADAVSFVYQPFLRMFIPYNTTSRILRWYVRAMLTPGWTVVENTDTGQCEFGHFPDS